MPKITFATAGDRSDTYEIATGQSLMRGAVEHGVAGIHAECGGAAACATCQVVITGEWAGKIPAPGPTEASMLDEEDLGQGRRLSCQITVTDELDGLAVKVWDN